MNLEDALDTLLKENMSEEGYKFWRAIYEHIPPVWNRPSSSTGKYHKKENGEVQTILEHTYEMAKSCCKVMRLFDNLKTHTQEADTLILGILLHDAFKYGVNSPLYAKHTDKHHDRISGNTVGFNKDKFLKILTEKQVISLEHITRFHSGIWSTDAKVETDFSINKLSHEAFFVHVLDMLSTNGCLRGLDIDEVKKEDATT